ncbi:hypothetical protein FRB97_000176 [Tulasnella sp. 331]|nr:hypothetical protein FRB97_000176 [Tulasnella sp. 331]
MLQLNNFANTLVKPWLDLLFLSPSSPFGYQSETLFRHCCKLLNYRYNVVQYIDLSLFECAINSCQQAVDGGERLVSPIGSGGHVSLALVEDLFRDARAIVEDLYADAYPDSEAIRGQFVEDIEEAEYQDAMAHYRARSRLRSVGSGMLNFAEALDTATIDVTLFIVEARPTAPPPILLRGNGIRMTSRFHQTLRLEGVIFKLSQDRLIHQKSHDYRFYERREGEQELTSQGVVFNAVGVDMTLAEVAKQAAPKRAVLELFLILAAKNDSFAIVIRGNPLGSLSGEQDVGEVVMKYNLKPKVLGGPGDIYREPGTMASILHEDVKWEDLMERQWVLALQWDPGVVACRLRTSAGDLSLPASPSGSISTLASNESYLCYIQGGDDTNRLGARSMWWGSKTGTILSSILQVQPTGTSKPVGGPRTSGRALIRFPSEEEWTEVRRRSADPDPEQAI